MRAVITKPKTSNSWAWEHLTPRTHERAADAFADRATDAFADRATNAFADRAPNAFGDEIRELVVFGSTVRGDTRGRDSDGDVLVVIDDAAHEDELRDFAYDVSLEHGVAVSLFVESIETVRRRQDHPLLRNVHREGRSYV